jgi:SAM-dependent methyltransferase
LRLWRKLRRADRRKAGREIAYWRGRKEYEQTLGHEHYEHFFTTHFGLEPDFYAGRSILDIGCGPRGSLEWATMASRRVGLDPLAGEYRELGVDAHAMEYVAAPAEAMPLPDDAFDVVSSFNSLDHVDDLGRTIGEIKRVVRPGGLFLLLTELGHEPTWEEPQDFSWEVVSLFEPELRPLDERHFEKSRPGIYDSVTAGVPYDHSEPTRRTGVLSAKFEAPST